MRILLCSQSTEISRELGTTNVIVNLAEGLKKLDWGVDFYWNETRLSSGAWSQALRRHLQKASAEFDVVDYPYSSLPYARHEFHRSTLMVARAPLLCYHFEKIQFPTRPTSVLSLVKRAVLPWRSENLEIKNLREAIVTADRSLKAADLVNVANSRDRVAVGQRGVPDDRILLLPYGVSSDFLALARENEPNDSDLSKPTVGFVGSFDFRKGCIDMRRIFARVLARFPGAQIRLLGTRGLFPDEESVERFLPRSIRRSATVVPHYLNHDLPKLLNGVDVGIFPSYIEGFGISVVEMLACGIPVVAYDSPGPCDILPPEDLVPAGRADQLADRVIELLCNREELSRKQKWARQRARDFVWDDIADATARSYRFAIQERQVQVLR